MSKIEHAHPNRKHGESQWITGRASKEYRTWMHIRNYEPGNVRWATQSEQQNNRNDTHRIEYKGKTMSMKQWCKELQIPYKQTWYRIQKAGWSVDKAFSYTR